MKKHLKSGFTMIELIFVIVILGILAAVALPKFAGVGSQAHVGNLKGFEGSLNGSVAPTAWAKVATQGGSLTKLKGKDQNLSTYTDVPQEFNQKDANISNLGNAVSTSKTDIVTGDKLPTDCDAIKDFNATVGKDIYKSCVVDGSSTTAPKFHIYKDN